MKRTILLLLLATLILGGCSTAVNQSPDKITVAVGIVPQATFVEKVAGDLVEVVTLIPPGNSPANYQPTANQMQALSEASLYFTMQTPTEEANILPKVSDFNQELQIINLREAVSEIYPLRMMGEHSHCDEHKDDSECDEGHEHHDHGDDEHEGDDHDEVIDPHLWLSPKRAAVMVQKIADELSLIDEANKQIYQENAQNYIAEIEALDRDIEAQLSATNVKAFMIYHGAYGYFADDYGLEMISLEQAGKPATAVHMQQVIERAKAEGIKTIFYQIEFDDNQAQTVAAEINGEVLRSEPLSPNYLQGLTDFTAALVEQGE